jgi:hypothetical protein
MKKVRRPFSVCECAWVVGGLVVGISQKFNLIREIIAAVFEVKKNKK